MQMFTLLLGDKSCEVQLGNEPEEGQRYLRYVNLLNFDHLINNKELLIG